MKRPWSGIVIKFMSIKTKSSGHFILPTYHTAGLTQQQLVMQQFLAARQSIHSFHTHKSEDCLLSLATWWWVFLCRTVWDYRCCVLSVVPARQQRQEQSLQSVLNIKKKVFYYTTSQVNTRTHKNHTLMCVMSAGALCIPAGTHFLLEGRVSSLPSRFHSPSSSRGVRWTLAADLSDCCSEASPSLLPPTSSFTCSLAGSGPGGFFRPDRRNEIHNLLRTNLDKHPIIKKFPPCACGHTNAQWVFLELWSEVGDLGQAEDVTLQHVPAHLVVEGITKLNWNLRWRWKKAILKISLSVADCGQVSVFGHTRVRSSMLQMLSCMGILKLCRKFPPNTIESTGV